MNEEKVTSCLNLHSISMGPSMSIIIFCRLVADSIQSLFIHGHHCTRCFDPLVFLTSLHYFYTIVLYSMELLPNIRFLFENPIYNFLSLTFYSKQKAKEHSLFTWRNLMFFLYIYILFFFFYFFFFIIIPGLYNVCQNTVTKQVLYQKPNNPSTEVPKL